MGEGRLTHVVVVVEQQSVQRNRRELRPQHCGAADLHDAVAGQAGQYRPGDPGVGGTGAANVVVGVGRKQP